MKKSGIVTLIIVLLCAVIAASCQKKDNEIKRSEDLTRLDYDYTEPEGGYSQLSGPQEGDLIATLKTTMGDITILLFPQYAPLAVENFTTHAKDGYYDGTRVNRAIYDFLFQAGAPADPETIEESIWGETFENEFTPQLHHIRGAVAMQTNDTQFYIVQKFSIDNLRKDLFQFTIENPESTLLDNNGDTYRLAERIPVPFLEYYIENGGAYHLDWPGYHEDDVYRKRTVFGQVISGMDVVDRIAAVETDEDDNPIEDVVIYTIIIEEYTK